MNIVMYFFSNRYWKVLQWKGGIRRNGNLDYFDVRLETCSIRFSTNTRTPSFEKWVHMIWGIAWWDINIYLVCGNTMCVSTCLVEFVLRELSFFILQPQSRFIGCSGDFSVLKRTVLLFNFYPGRSYRKFAGTTLAFRIIINCTTAKSVLELVSLFRLASLPNVW